VTAVDERAFVWARGFIEQWIGEIARRARRLAIVRPAGLAGATLTGLFYDWVQPRFDAKLFGERSAALDWLEVDAVSRAAIDELHDSFMQTPWIRQLREALARDLRDATVDRIAEALAISARSLQRQLSGHDTSFSDELARARIRAAEAMLLESVEKIETIATHVGFRSPSAFTAMFRRVNGETPIAFRERAFASLATRRPTSEH
jgi:AraC-like DNA-binding protein